MGHWPDRVLTMPATDDYYVVSSEKLDMLVETRISWAAEGLLASIGLFGGSIVATAVALWNWPLDADGLINTVITALAIGSGSVFLIVVLIRRRKFGDIIKKIKAGKRYVTDPRGAGLVEAPLPTTPPIAEKPKGSLLGRLSRRNTAEETPQ